MFIQIYTLEAAAAAEDQRDRVWWRGLFLFNQICSYTIYVMKIERPKSKQPIPADAKKVFTGVIFDVYQWEQKLYDGTTTTFEKLKRPDTVVTFPVLDDGRIILAEQEQPGKVPYISAIGGRIDEGEDILVAAKRELLEETGYKAEHFTLWKADQPTSKIDYAIYFFIAKGLKKISEPSLDGGEKIKLKFVTFNELIDLSTDKKFMEKEILLDLLEAKFVPAKKEELKKLFEV